MLRRGAVLAVLGIALIVLVGLAFAGSPARIARRRRDCGDSGRRDDGAGGKTDARTARRGGVSFAGRLHRRRRDVPGRRPGSSAIEADWASAVALARRENNGFGPVRGFRRLHTRIFGEEIAPRVTVFNGALEYQLDQIASAVDRPHVEASLRRRGLRIEVVPARRGQSLQRETVAAEIVRALGSLERRGPVPLPVAGDTPEVTAAMLAPAARHARLALSAPVRLTYGETVWRLPRWRIAELLSLPKDGGRNVAIAGTDADRWFAALARRVDREPVDAGFAVSGGGIRIVPSKTGLGLDVPATARAIAAAAFAPTGRTAAARGLHDAAGADDARGEGDGDHRRRRLVHDDLRRHAGPAAQRPARRRN